MRVASKHLVAEREAVEGHDESYQYLLAIGTVITRVTALCQRIYCSLAFKVGARHVVKQNLILDREQLACAPRKMCFNRRLVPEQMIKSAIEAILVDLLIAELQQITQRRAPIPILGNVQFASGLAQARRYQDGGDLLPGDALLTRRQQLIAQLRQTRPPPQRQSQIHIAELA